MPYAITRGTQFFAGLNDNDDTPIFSESKLSPFDTREDAEHWLESIGLADCFIVWVGTVGDRFTLYDSKLRAIATGSTVDDCLEYLGFIMNVNGLTSFDTVTYSDQSIGIKVKRTGDLLPYSIAPTCN